MDHDQRAQFRPCRQALQATWQKLHGQAAEELAAPTEAPLVCALTG
ncbi:hypothetical protein ABZ825_27295 [Streptomyces tauricus]